MNWLFIVSSGLVIIFAVIVFVILIRDGISWRLIVWLLPHLLFVGWVFGVMSCEWKKSGLQGGHSNIQKYEAGCVQPMFLTAPPLQFAALNAELPPHPVLRELPGVVEWPRLQKITPDGRYAVVSIQFKPYDMTVYCLLFQLDDAEVNYDRARTMPSDLGALPERCDYFLLWHDERRLWIAPGWN